MLIQQGLGERGGDPIGEFREGERTSPEKSPPLTYFDFSVKEQRERELRIERRVVVA